MKSYSRRLKEERIFQNMSRKGNCHDNSVMENFFGLFKQEIYYGVVYYSYEELKSEIERYIYTFFKLNTTSLACPSNNSIFI